MGSTSSPVAPAPSPLVPCPACKTPVSRAAPTCPKCGQPLAPEANYRAAGNVNGWGVLLILLGIGGGIIGATLGLGLLSIPTGLLFILVGWRQR